MNRVFELPILVQCCQRVARPLQGQFKHASLLILLGAACAQSLNGGLHARLASFEHHLHNRLFNPRSTEAEAGWLSLFGVPGPTVVARRPAARATVTNAKLVSTSRTPQQP